MDVIHFASKVGEVHVVEKMVKLMRLLRQVMADYSSGSALWAMFGRIALVLSHLATGNKTLLIVRDDFQHEMHNAKLK